MNPESNPEPQLDPPEPELPLGFSADKQRERPHPLTPLIRGWVVLLALLVALSREVLSWLTESSRMPPVTGILGFGGAIVFVAMAIGMISWLATGFVIDGEELRIETGILFRKSQRIAFDKVSSIDVLQPLAARMFSLAELEIDTGSTRRVKLRYLSRARAYALRDYLLARARGHQAQLATRIDRGFQLTDLDAEDQIVVKIRPGRVFLGAITSNEFFALLFAIAGTIVAAAFFSGYLGGIVVLLALGLSAISGIVGFVARRIVGQFNFILSTRPSGLRISRGLTSLTSQSLPPRRIQVVRLTQSFLWRWFGWYRVEIDALGVGIRNEDDTQSSVSSVLLPIATIDQVRCVLELMWPESDFEAVALRPPPRRARFRHPLSAPFLAAGHDQSLVISRHGWLERRWDLLPHVRVQSIEISQGPISRGLGLADLSFHSAGGRISVRARGLSAAHVGRQHEELITLAQAHQRDITLGSEEPDDRLPGAENDQLTEGPLAFRADHADDAISKIE